MRYNRISGVAIGLLGPSIAALACLFAFGHGDLQWANDAGHNILGIPWWVWLVGGLTLATVAIIVAPELIPVAPELLEALEAGEEAATLARQAAFEAELESRGVSEAIAEAMNNNYAIHERAGWGLRMAVEAGKRAAGEAWVTAWEQSIAQQEASAILAGRIVDGAVAAGGLAAATGASQIPGVLEDLTASAGAAGNAPSGVNPGD